MDLSRNRNIYSASGSSTNVYQKGVSRPKGFTLIFTLLTALHIVYGGPVHQLDSPCSSYCGDHFLSLAEWTSCARGCRFFSMIQLHYEQQPPNAIQKDCISTCNMAYNETELRKACSRGCRKSTEMVTEASKTGHSNPDHRLLDSAEQWIHHLGMSPFEESLEAHHRELIWPFQFLNDIYKQLSDPMTTSSSFIKSRSSFTLLFGDGSNGRQIFLVRARPHLTLSDPSSLSSHSSLSLNPIHEQSTFHVIAFPSVSTSSSASSTTNSGQPTSHPIPNKQVKVSSSIVSPLAHNMVNYQTFTRWVTDTSSTVFKDLRLLMALLLAVILLSIVTFSEALCWTVDGRNRKTINNESREADQDKSENTETSPFFILENSVKARKEAEANAGFIEDVNREKMIQEESERPPTYDETIKTSVPNFDSSKGSEA